MTRTPRSGKFPRTYAIAGSSRSGEERWARLGATLGAARQALGLSKREAARRADLSDGAWRHLEAGQKLVYGKIVLPNPRPENLISATRAVGLRPEKLFHIVGMPVPHADLNTPSEDELAAEIRNFAPIDRQLVEHLIYRLAR